MPLEVTHHVFCGPPGGNTGVRAGEVRFDHPGQHHTRDVHLAPRAAISGTVTLNGEPAVGIVTWRTDAVAGSAAIGETGAYSIDAPIAGPLRLTAAAEIPGNPTPSDGKAVLARRSVDVTIPAAGSVIQDLQIVAPLTLVEGVVTRPDSRPHPDLEVRITSLDGHTTPL